jgi:hypothetical protein
MNNSDQIPDAAGHADPCDRLLEKARTAKRAKDKAAYRSACEAWLLEARGIHVGDTVKLHYSGELREVHLETFELHWPAGRAGHRDSDAGLRRPDGAEAPATRRAREQLVFQRHCGVEKARPERVPAQRNDHVGAGRAVARSGAGSFRLRRRQPERQAAPSRHHHEAVERLPFTPAPWSRGQPPSQGVQSRSGPWSSRWPLGPRPDRRSPDRRTGLPAVQPRPCAMTT